MPKRQTVLLTGISGFIAKHIALNLLNEGYDVVGSVRSLARGDEVRAAVAPHLNASVDLEKSLRFVTLNLDRDDGWDAAMQGVDILMHTASPFPLAPPKIEDDLIRPAVDGTLRAMRAAHNAGVKRVVVTSSFAAIMHSKLPGGRTAHDETDWSDTNSASIDPYSKSKTLAEKAAWEFVSDQAPDIVLTTINPTMVLGPPLDNHFGSSVELVQRILRAKDPMVPRFGLGCVDVRDVARIHVDALGNAATQSKRIIAVDRFMWLTDLSHALKEHFPDRKLVTRQAPDFVVRLLGIFDKSIRQIVPDLGKKLEISNVRAKDLFGMEFIAAEESVVATAKYLIDHDQVG